MKLIWTRTRSNDIIAWGTEEPVSHFAMLFFDCIVFHSTFAGVDIVAKQDFLANRSIIFQKDIAVDRDSELEMLIHLSTRETWKHYDWSFFFWLVGRVFLLKVFSMRLPKNAPRTGRDEVLCTEILDLLPENTFNKYHNLNAVTPFDLYNKLSEAEDGHLPKPDPRAGSTGQR